MKSYLVDEKGKKKAVVVDINEFRQLIEHLEEMKDALELKKAIAKGGEFVELRKFINRMKKECRL